jgi:hypothetical protein
MRYRTPEALFLEGRANAERLRPVGPECAALVDGLEQLDPENDKLGAEIIYEFAALNRLCTR